MSLFAPLDGDDPAIAELLTCYAFPPETFTAHRFWRRTDSGAIWVTSAGVDRLPDAPLEAVGLLVTREGDNPTRVSAEFARRFGPLARQATVTLSIDDTTRYARGSDVPWPATATTERYLIVCGQLEGADGVTRRVGLGRGRRSGDRLASELPKASHFATAD